MTDAPQVNVRQFQLLFVDWFRKLARDAGLPLEQFGTTNQAFTIGTPDALLITAKFVAEPPYLQFESNDPGRETLVQEVAREAARRTSAGESAV